jgi:hypothetical protein
MIKDLKRYQLKLTPFQATKNWELDNIFNDNLLLLEQTGSDGSDIALGLEFLEYGDGSESPQTGSACDISLEQQDADRALFKEGQNISGLFYPDSDPKNSDGTYKRLVYSQYKSSFYNDFRNPTEIWGVENIDFELSKTKRYLAQGIQVFEIPRLVYGDKILPKSVVMHNQSQDNEYVVMDDGDGNLIAGINLFSHVQEIGKFGNDFTVGSSGFCNDYFNHVPPPSNSPSGSTVLIVSSGSAVLSWSYSSNDENGFNIEESLDGITYNNIFVLSSPDSRSYTDTLVFSGNTYWYRMNAFNNAGTSSYSNTASIFFSGSPVPPPSCITMSSFFNVAPTNDNLNIPEYVISSPISSVHRLVVSDAGLGNADVRSGVRNTWFINTDTNATLNIYTASRVHFQSGKLTNYAGGEWVFLDDGNVAETIAPNGADPINSIHILSFDANGNYVISSSVPHLGGRDSTAGQFGSGQDYVWVYTQDGTNVYLEQFNPLTNTFISEATLGTFSATSSAFYFGIHQLSYPAYGNIYSIDDSANSIKQIYVNCIANQPNGSGDQLEVYNITAFTNGSSPILSHVGSINLLADPYVGWSGGWVYVPLTKKVYIGAGSGSNFDPVILEINPQTLTIDFVYDLTQSPFSSNIFPVFVTFNDVTNALYFGSGNSDIGVIDPVLSSSVCVSSVASSAVGSQTMAVNQTTGKVYYPIASSSFGSNEIGIFNKAGSTSSLWPALLWDKSGDVIGDFSGSVVTDTTTGLNINCIVVEGNPSGGFFAPAALPIGTASYQGSSISAHVSIHSSASSVSPSNQTNVTVIYDLGGPDNSTLFTSPGLLPTGEFDFTIPDSPLLKVVTVFVLVSNATVIGTTVSMTAVLT